MGIDVYSNVLLIGNLNSTSTNYFLWSYGESMTNLAFTHFSQSVDLLLGIEQIRASIVFIKKRHQLKNLFKQTPRVLENCLSGYD